MDSQLDRNSISRILQELWTRSQGKGAQSTLLSKHKDVARILDAEYPSIDHYGQKAYLWVNDLKSPPTCYCGQYTIFKSYSRGYGDYCGIKCMSKCPNTLEKRSSTIRAKYGVNHFSKTDEYKHKFKQTCLHRYGVINPGQIPDLKLKRAKTKSQTYIHSLLKSETSYIAKFDPNEFMGVHEPSDWTCITCSTEFTMPNLVQGVRCPTCYPKITLVGESKQEIELAEWVRSLGVTMERKNREILGKKELDIWIANHKLAIEVCGSYYHSDRFVNKKYHQDKMLECERQGIQLITLFDFDLKNTNVVHDMLMHKLGLNHKPKFKPRQGVIKEISGTEAKQFNTQYHLRGHAAASNHLGFYVGSELIAVSSWSEVLRPKGL